MIAGSADRADAMALDERRRFLAYSDVAISPRDRLVIAGIVRGDIARDLEPDARLVPLLPHDADLVLVRTDPDVVLVESSAVLPGHAWAGAGEPSIADVALRLLGVLDVAARLGRPSVLWWDCPRQMAAGLMAFERRFDLVVAPDTHDDTIDLVWTAGVQLARFSPLGAPADRPTNPVAHGSWDRPLVRAQRRFMETIATVLADDELELWMDAEAVEEARWAPPGRRAADMRRVASDELADRYRAHGLFLADPPIAPTGHRLDPTRALRQLATGARVVSGPNDALAAELGDWIDWTPEADRISETIRAAVGRGPRTASELRALLRDLFHGHDTTSSVDALASLIGVRGAARRRHASVVVQPEEGVRLDAFLDSVILQSFRPKDALIAVDDPVAARMAIAELERAGIAARVLPPPAPDRGIARWAAPLVSTDWLWLWSPKARPDRDFLLDAVIHGCVTGAEAIGRGDAVESGFTDGSGLERLDGLVVSRHAAMTLPDVHAGLAAAWHARGARVYAVGMDRDGR